MYRRNPFGFVFGWVVVSPASADPCSRFHSFAPFSARKTRFASLQSSDSSVAQPESRCSHKRTLIAPKGLRILCSDLAPSTFKEISHLALSMTERDRDKDLRPYAAGIAASERTWTMDRMSKCRGRHGCRERPYLQHVEETCPDSSDAPLMGGPIRV